ncbi:hypothetical protein HDU97_005433 [Phlyctochytrium planicorne]|nr:hypothetical protein HDU97_005433 [Phlyctochytrium planicorne]
MDQVVKYAEVSEVVEYENALFCRKCDEGKAGAANPCYVGIDVRVKEDDDGKAAGSYNEETISKTKMVMMAQAQNPRQKALMMFAMRFMMG